MNFTLSLPRDYYFISSFDSFLMRRCLCLQNILKLDETHFKGRDKIFFMSGSYLALINFLFIF